MAQEIQVSKEEVVAKLQSRDAQFILDFFFPDEDHGVIPDFQALIWNYFRDEEFDRVAVAIPRGHGKTTWAKVLVAINFLVEEISFITYASHTHTIAAHAAADIIKLLSSRNVVAVFGRITFLVMQESIGFYKFRMGNKICMLKAFGSGQQVRGINIENRRPELTIVDDIEDADQIKTPEAKEQLRLWFFGTYLEALAKNGRAIVIGNMIGEDCLIADLVKLPDWRSLVLSQLVIDEETGKLKPIWPEKESLTRALRKYQEFKKLGILYRWFAECMNMPVNLSGMIIDPNDISYAPHAPFSHMFVTIDPAFSQQNYSDDSAIVVHGYNTEINCWQIIDKVFGKFSINELYTLTLAFMQKYKITTIAIESNGAQKVLSLLFETYLISSRITNFDIIEVQSQAAKHTRILAFCGYLEKGLYRLSEGEVDIPLQLSFYNPRTKNNRDDLIDACAMGVYIIENHFAALSAYVNDNAAFSSSSSVLVNHQLYRKLA